MPIKEESFRIGSGRYLQGRGYISKVGEEIARLGKKPLLVCGRTALEKTEAALMKSLDGCVENYEMIVHTKTCNEECAKEIGNYAREKGYDVIVGVGGGVICDFAKLCAHFSDTPVINVPTSSATCASYTPLSVRYSLEGRTVGTMHYKEEVDCVVADTDIIFGQPIRLFLAGVFDALAKFVEIKQRFREGSTQYPLGLDYAYVMSKYSFKLLCDNTQSCIEEMESGVMSDNYENVVFTCIAATGVISGIARGSNQTAIAHKFYDSVRLLFPHNTSPFTHGEIVGVGLLMQNYFNGEEENNALLLSLMRKYNLPCCINDLNIPKDNESFEALYESISKSSAVEDEERNRFRESLKYLWELGK